MIKMSNWLKGLLALVALGLLVLAGCNEPEPTQIVSPTSTLAPQVHQLEWEKVAQYEGGGAAPSPDEQPRLAVVTTPEHLLKLDEYISPTVMQQTSQVDFTTHFILVVFQGYKGVSNYSVEVEEIALEDSTITVGAKFLEPDPEEVIVNIDSSPYCMVKVKKTASLHGEFMFVLIADGHEIERKTIVIP